MQKGVAVDRYAVIHTKLEYFSVNVFCNNHSKIRRDEAWVEWFVAEVYPFIKDDERIEVLLGNTDLGVG